METLDTARAAIDEIDRAMARLFETRMRQVAVIAAEKRCAGAPVRNPARERQVLQNGLACLTDAGLAGYYTGFCRSLMAQARRYQQDLAAGAMGGKGDADETDGSA